MNQESVAFLLSLFIVIDMAILEIPGRTGMRAWARSETRLVQAVFFGLPQIGS